MVLFTIRLYLFAVLLSMFWCCFLFHLPTTRRFLCVIIFCRVVKYNIRLKMIIFNLYMYRWSCFDRILHSEICYIVLQAVRGQMWISTHASNILKNSFFEYTFSRKEREKTPTEAKFEMKKDAKHTNTQQKKHPSKRKQQTHTLFSMYLNIYLSHLGQPTKPNTYNPLAHNYITIVSSPASLLFCFSRLSFVDICFS